MATAMKVPTIFTAVDRFSHVVDRMSKSASAFGATAQASAMRTSRRLSSMGTSMLTTGATIGVGLGLAIDQSIKYEKAIASLAAVTGTKTGSMNKQIEELGRETKRSVIDIAKSFEIVGSKMSEYLDNPIALQKITRASVLMADAARMELEPAIDSLTGVMNIYGKTANDAYNIVDKLSAGETVGSVSIQQSADILTQFGAQAVRANVPIEESIALIQTLTKSLGVEGVGRGLRNILFDISSTETWDKKRWKAIKMAGVDFKFVTNNANKLTDRLRELKKLTSVKGAMELFFKRTGTVAANTLFQNFDKGESNFISFLDKIQKLNDAQEKAAKNNATMDKKLKDLKNTIILMAIKIGDVMLPILTDFVNYMMPIIASTSAWIKENKSLVKIIFWGTVSLLALGVALKVGAVLFYGIAKVIGIVSAVTKAYTFISTLAALANVSFATALWGVVTALWAALWPVLAVVAALAIMVVWIYDVVNHWSDWKEILLVMVGPIGWITYGLLKILEHSRKIRNAFAFEGWFGGLKAIGRMLVDMILTPLEKIFNVMSRLPMVGDHFKFMSASIADARSGFSATKSVGNLSGSSQFQNLGGTMPTWGAAENLAGKNQNQASMEKGGTLRVVIDDKTNKVKDVDDTNVYGIPVVLSGNQGNWGR